MIDLLISYRYPPEFVWDCSPRQMMEILPVARKRRQRELREMAIAVRGTPQALEDMLKS